MVVTAHRRRPKAPPHSGAFVFPGPFAGRASLRGGRSTAAVWINRRVNSRRGTAGREHGAGLRSDAGLVVDRPAGNRRIYHADPEGVAALRSQLDRFWNQAPATFKAVVEQDEREVE